MQFVSAPTLSPNAGADLPCPVIQSRIGSKRSGSCSSKVAAAKLGALVANPMENALADLAQALRERLVVIRDQQSRRDQANHIARLKAVSEKIETLQEALPRPVDPRLAHYLQRKSFDKALEYLETTCRGGQ